MIGARDFSVLITVAALVALVSRRAGLPDELALLLVGIAIALALPEPIVVDPQVVLFVLLPGLVFEAAHRLEYRELRRSLWATALLALPGVIITATAVAFVLMTATGLTAVPAFLIGAVVSPTDPAAMVAAFSRLRAPVRLSTIVQAESLLNDGTGVVLFGVAVGLLHSPVSLWSASGEIAWVIAGSIGVGIALGAIASRLLATVDDYVVEIALTVALAYGSYLLADELRLSGIIATVVGAITLGNYGSRIGMSESTSDAVDTFWSVVAFVLTAFVFLLIGVAVPVTALPHVVGPILWGTVGILLGRAIAVYVLIGLGRSVLRLLRQPVAPWRWLHVLFWAGLRGAVAVALALSLPTDTPRRQDLQAIVFGVVLITIVVQGSTAGILTRRVLGQESS